mgnify:CR=1 FL=1
MQGLIFKAACLWYIIGVMTEKDGYNDREKLVDEAELIVFDMDGTLYELDGEEGGFTGSSLCKQMFENTVSFIAVKEGVGCEKAEKIMAEALDYEVGMSVFLANRYGITRKDCFDVTWNIDPNGIVQNFKEAVEVVRKLEGMGKTLILLTQAPSVWQKRVIEYIGLEGVFEMVVTGEEFGGKAEVMKGILEEYKSLSMLSVGDQLETDIEPALNLGMKAILVESPADLAKWLQ